MYLVAKEPDVAPTCHQSSSGATSLDWSHKYPNLLAVGHYDGSIIVYEVSGDGATALLDSTQMPTKHTDAVWDIKWVDKGADQGESLVSISTDGRVTEWSIKKGLVSDLMVLKRITNEFFKDVGNTSIGTVTADGADKKKASVVVKARMEAKTVPKDTAMALFPAVQVDCALTFITMIVQRTWSVPRTVSFTVALLVTMNSTWTITLAMQALFTVSILSF